MRKLREAGLDPYMQMTWQEAQVHLREKQERDQAQAQAAHQYAEWERAHQPSPPVQSEPPTSVLDALYGQPTQQSAPVIDAPPVKPRGGKVAKPCPYCGVEFKALHWHVGKCKMRPA